MPALVQKDAEAMWGTMTAFSHSSSPAFISGSSSKTSRPALQHTSDPQCCHQKPGSCFACSAQRRTCKTRKEASGRASRGMLVAPQSSPWADCSAAGSDTHRTTTPGHQHAARGSQHLKSRWSQVLGQLGAKHSAAGAQDKLWHKPCCKWLPANKSAKPSLPAENSGDGVRMAPTVKHLPSREPCQQHCGCNIQHLKSGLALRCATRSVSLTTGPREALMSRASFFMWLKRSLLIKCLVAGTRAQCRLTTCRGELQVSKQQGGP